MAYVHNIICILDCNGVLEVINPKDQEREKFHISLHSIMIFATGMAKEPPMGLTPNHPYYFMMIICTPQHILVAVLTTILLY